MKLEVYSDTICPWCYVGFARLQQALAARPELAVEVAWLPYELNPDLPPEGEDRKAYMLRRFGDVNRFAAGQRQLIELGASLGIGYVGDATNVSNEMIKTGGFEIEVALKRYKVTAQLQPWYDPKSERVRA